jgi:hypothetical protein
VKPEPKGASEPDGRPPSRAPAGDREPPESSGQPSVWRERARTILLASAALLALSGALATIHHRPWSHRAPGHIGFAVALVAAVRTAHRAAALTLVVAALAMVWLRPRPAGRAVLVAVALGGAMLATGLVTPWPSLLPWAGPQGSNLGRPMLLLGREGPFPELVGVNVVYDDTVLALGRLRLGPRGVGRLYLAHVVFLPVAVLAVAAIARRRNRTPL